MPEPKGILTHPIYLSSRSTPELRVGLGSTQRTPRCGEKMQLSLQWALPSPPRRAQKGNGGHILLWGRTSKTTSHWAEEGNMQLFSLACPSWGWDSGWLKTVGEGEGEGLKEGKNGRGWWRGWRTNVTSSVLLILLTSVTPCPCPSYPTWKGPLLGSLVH